jgi:hypothetical protein
MKRGMSSADRDITVHENTGSASVCKYTKICRTLCSYRGVMEQNVTKSGHLKQSQRVLLDAEGTVPNAINPLNAELNPICHLLALLEGETIVVVSRLRVNPLNAELNPICHLLALLRGATIVVVSRLRVNPSNAELNPICHLLALLGGETIVVVSRLGLTL